MATSSTQKVHLIWLADNIDELKKNFPQAFTHLRGINNSIETFSDANLFANSLFENNDEKVFTVITGTLGEQTVPIIHDMLQLDSIFVFCQNRVRHEQWAKEWPKVKGVFNKIDIMCQAIEHAVQQPELIQPKSSPTILHPVTIEPPQQTTHPDRASPVDHQRRESSHRRRRRDRSPLSTQDEADTTVSNQPHALREEQKRSPVRSFKEPATHSSPLINSRQQLPSDFDQSERTLTETTEQKLRNSFFTNTGNHLSTSFDTNTIDRLQDTIVQTIEKHVTTKKDDSNVLNHLFADLKQALVETILQQQQQPPALPHNVIKQTVLDILSEQKNSALNPTTTTTADLVTHRRSLTVVTNREIKITANLKQTRVDATFRQQRDAVVANKRLRDAVQQWSSVRSMGDLVTAIRRYGENDLECAWLLFCWIGQNIEYQAYCNSNSAESVFRTRKGVCRGFVSLYHECCSLLNIECWEISGYAKQAFLKPGEELKQSPHAWNSIVLDQYTYLIDPTWGAGGRDNDKKLEDFYFLTSPEELIYTHFCNGYQLLEPEISKKDFLDLPVMKSTYYRLGLTLLSPKQGMNETNQNLFKIIIRTPKHIDLFIELKVSDIAYPRSLHTLCQRDETEPDVYNCYVTPPVNGLYDVGIYAKTNNETLYRDAINMRLRVTNLVDAFTFPLIYSTFTEHNCILIEPLQRLVHKDEEVLIHMIIPHANVIKIQNGDDYIVPGKDEYKKGLLRKQIRVQGDLHVCGRWDDKADSISIICVFSMI